MAILSKEQIRQADDFVKETVSVPEWGGEVIVKGLIGKERDEYEQSIVSMRRNGTLVPNLSNARAKLVVRACINEDGEQLFSENDIGWLGNKSARALSRVSDKAQKLAGLSNEDMEELLGNSETAPSDASTSD